MGEFNPLELYLDLVSNPPADNLTARVAGKCLEDLEARSTGVGLSK